jgi:NAD(P)-dependent dehydrogenase (short-subunit alcohol dehydrogenase family)
MSTDRFILVLGSGPGIGVGVASCFAEKGFRKVALLSRNAARLKEDAASVTTASEAGVKTYAADLADSEGLKTVLSTIETEMGIPDVVVYNASHLTKSTLGEYGEDEVEVDLRVRGTLRNNSLKVHFLDC